jgi:hypothetical protein
MEETLQEQDKSSKAALDVLRSHNAQLTMQMEVCVLFCHVYVCIYRRVRV